LKTSFAVLVESFVVLVESFVVFQKDLKVELGLGIFVT